MLTEPEQPIPFMTAVGGHVLIHHGQSGAPLADDWTGVCVDGDDTTKFWFIGSEDGERSYSRLQAKSLAEACSEVESRGLSSEKVAGTAVMERQR